MIPARALRAPRGECSAANQRRENRDELSLMGRGCFAGSVSRSPRAAEAVCEAPLPEQTAVRRKRCRCSTIKGVVLGHLDGDSSWGAPFIAAAVARTSPAARTCRTRPSRGPWLVAFPRAGHGARRRPHQSGGELPLRPAHARNYPMAVAPMTLSFAGTNGSNGLQAAVERVPDLAGHTGADAPRNQVSLMPGLNR